MSVPPSVSPTATGGEALLGPGGRCTGTGWNSHSWSGREESCEAECGHSPRRGIVRWPLSVARAVSDANRGHPEGIH